ncbi:MAG: fructosamine kinase family protein [Acetilactobacillus jinshanensis]
MTVNSEWIKRLPIKNIKSVTPVSGGDINEAYCVKTNQKKYFMKVQPGRGKNFFFHEVEGLNLLSQAAFIPKVITYGQIGRDGYLILKWINFGTGSQYKLGQTVAKVHRIHSRKFGLDHDFKLGKIPKNNHWQNSWIKFYINQRLDPLVNLPKRITFGILIVSNIIKTYGHLLLNIIPNLTIELYLRYYMVISGLAMSTSQPMVSPC